jgi:oxygen-independent coproporphyrinogen-3 oxidase
VIVRRLVTDDGVVVALARARAYRDHRPAALLVHGAFSSHRLWLGAHAGEGGLCHFLTERGLDVWMADLRHHGDSDREPHRMCWRFEDWIRHDAPTLAARIDEETGGAPLFWIGHSAGGAVGLCWLARCGRSGALAGVVTFGTPAPVGVVGKRRFLARGSVAVAHTLGRFPARLLRVGAEDEAGGILIEWMGWNLGGRWLGADGFDYLRALGRIDTPLLSVAGERDRFYAPPWACERLLHSAGTQRKESMVCPGLSHVGLVKGARARERCWPRVAQWIDETLRQR